MIDRYTYYYRKGKIKTFNELSNPSIHHIPIWLEKVRKNDYFKEFDCYLFGSLMDKSNARDMDIFFTGDYMPELIVDLLDYSLNVGINEMGIRMDVFYIPDFTYLTYPPHFTSTKRFKVFTSYDLEMEVVKGKMTMFRDFGLPYKDGLYETFHTQHHQKSIERGTTTRIKKLS